MTDKQKHLAELLKNFDPKISEIYLGSLSVLDQDYAEKISQSAHSIREMIALLAENPDFKEVDTKIEDKKNAHKAKLIQRIDPLGGSPSQLHYLYDDLVKNYHRWFLSVTHHRRIVSEKQFRNKITKLEELLEKIIRPHFDVIQNIDDILKQKPTKKIFNDLKPFLARNLSSYNYFFQRASSNWIPFLISGGFFDNPPLIIKTSEGIRFPVWAPSRYLVKISQERPKEVTKIILNYKTPPKEKRHIWILSDFVSAALEMPARYAKQISCKIHNENWSATPYFSLLDKNISDLMIKLCEAGIQKESLHLTKMLLNVKLSEPRVEGGILEDYKTVYDVITIIDHYSYEQILKNQIPILFNAFPTGTLEVLISKLNKIISLENKGHGYKTSKEDASPGWRPAIEPHEQNWDSDFRSLFVGMTGELLLSYGRTNIKKLKKDMKFLKQKHFAVFRRLELHVYQYFPKQFKKEIENAVFDCFDKPEFKHEYYHLLRKSYSLLSRNTKKKFWSLIEKGPKKDRIRYWKSMPNTKPNYVQFRINLWQSEKIEPIKSHLKGHEKVLSEKLLSKVGTSQFPDFNSYHSQVKTSEPITDLQDNLTVDDVFKFLESYTVKEQSFGFHDGTAEKLQEYVQKEPLKFSKNALLLQSTQPILTYRFFWGLEESLKQNSKICWPPVLKLCLFVVESIKNGTYDEPKGYNILNAIASLVNEGLGKDSIDFKLRKEVWNLLNLLNSLEYADGLWHENYPQKNWSSYGISINTVSGETFHAIIAYLHWCGNNHKKTSKFHMPSEVKTVFADYFNEKSQNSISRHAVLGINFFNLDYYDSKFARKNLKNLFYNKNEILARSAWDAYLIGKVYSKIVGLLFDKYLQHIETLKTPQLQDGQLNELDKRLIDHVTLTYIFKIKNTEKLFFRLLEISDNAVISHCVWFVGRFLHDREETTSTSLDLERIRQIWRKGRLSDHPGTGWWFYHSPFKKSESIDLLLSTLKKSSGKIEFASLVLEKLECYAKSHPSKTVQCIELLIKSKGVADGELHLAREKCKNILKELLKCKNSSIVNKAKSLIHYLGELGYNEYRDLLTDR